MTAIAELDERTRTELEAAAFRTLVEHLRAHPEVQNIDLMNLAGFCRNCLSKWYRAAALERGLDLSDEQAREIVYGMPYAEWKAKHQTEATPEQQAKLAERHGSARVGPAAPHGDRAFGSVPDRPAVPLRRPRLDFAGIAWGRPEDSGETQGQPMMW